MTNEKKPTAMLKEEHEKVLQKLDALKEVISHLDNKEEISATLKELASFFKTDFWVHFTKEEEIMELDLRPMPPFERHEKIFQMWGALKSGETLRITNDHDPKPLYYQFEAEYKGQYEWEYEQSGPKDWIVKIKKV